MCMNYIWTSTMCHTIFFFFLWQIKQQIYLTMQRMKTFFLSSVYEMIHSV